MPWWKKNQFGKLMILDFSNSAGIAPMILKFQRYSTKDFDILKAQQQGFWKLS